MIEVSTCFAKFGTKKNEIRWAIAVFPSHHPKDYMRACVVEEMTQVLGLPNDSNAVKPSIFNDLSHYFELTPHDRLMVKMLYDPPHYGRHAAWPSNPGGNGVPERTSPSLVETLACPNEPHSAPILLALDAWTAQIGGIGYTLPWRTRLDAFVLRRVTPRNSGAIRQRDAVKERLELTRYHRKGLDET
ncbi:MAG: hypothetical protein CFH02_00106 [Alphaproteobacteria bacterium MarineAlpha3_Bin1]|nr:MAG: hypothetical protein CFH02_00106 [Alphaproteobacteria bacterium MarineAlpha3_Bin1]